MALVEAARTLSKEDMELAIIGTIGSMDSPMSPSQQGVVSLQRWMRKETPEARQAWRDQVLSTTPEDLMRFGQRLADASGTGKDVIVGSRTAFENAQKDGVNVQVQDLF
jgi:Zn-dependent M16 (insulinase) family peptidase